MNTLNITIPIGSALFTPTGYKCRAFMSLLSMNFEAPKRMTVERRSIAESTTEAIREMELETRATVAFKARRMMFCREWRQRRISRDCGKAVNNERNDYITEEATDDDEIDVDGPLHQSVRLVLEVVLALVEEPR
jgi:hypothetical protein